MGVLINDTEPDVVPPGPWRWEETDLGGTVLRAASGAVLLEVDGGHGVPHLYNSEVEALLRQAWQLPQLVSELSDLSIQLDEARAWARGYETGMFTVDTDNPPGWLTAPSSL